MQTADSIQRFYYSIGEVADMLGVAPSLIRFWETEFPQLEPRKNQKGNRQYTRKDIELLQTIYHLVKEKGYTLEGANKLLRKRKALEENAQAISDKLLRIRSELLFLDALLQK